ncbi:MAG: hypothetical protein ACJA2S_003893, partial [Cyclobacteriaceae bacterium]
MSTNRKYHRLIYTLIRFKDHWQYVEDSKFQSLKQTLSQFEIDPLDEGWEKIPSNQKLSEMMGIPRLKVNTLIRQMHKRIIDSFYDYPPGIDRTIHNICIGIPYDERIKYGKRISFEEDEKSTSVNLSLAVTPQVGEMVELGFTDDTKWTRGYVYEVVHLLEGQDQVITVFAHP